MKSLLFKSRKVLEEQSMAWMDFRNADLGCSSAPNTLLLVKTFEQLIFLLIFMLTSFSVIMIKNKLFLVSMNVTTTPEMILM